MTAGGPAEADAKDGYNGNINGILRLFNAGSSVPSALMSFGPSCAGVPCGRTMQRSSVGSRSMRSASAPSTGNTPSRSARTEVKADARTQLSKRHLVPTYSSSRKPTSTPMQIEPWSETTSQTVRSVCSRAAPSSGNSGHSTTCRAIRGATPVSSSRPTARSTARRRRQARACRSIASFPSPVDFKLG